MVSWSSSDRGVIEETPGLTIDDLKAWGFLVGYARGIITGKRNGRDVWSVGVSVDIKPAEEEDSYIQFSYYLNDNPVKHRHGIELFSCNYGGYRAYFRCKDCGKRIMTLYLRRGYFSCRHCHRLVYLVSRRHRSLFEEIDRANALTNKVKRLIKRGHPRKAKRLQWKVDELKYKSLLHAAEYFKFKGIGIDK